MINISKTVIKALISLKTGEKGKLVSNLLYLMVNMRRMSDCGFIALDYNPGRRNDEFHQLRKVLAKNCKFNMSVMTLADVFNFGIECGFFHILKTKKKKGNLMRVRFSINTTRDGSNYIKVDVDEKTTKTQLLESISKILILDKIDTVQKKAKSISKKANGRKFKNKKQNANAKKCKREKFMMEYNVISYDTFESLVLVGRNKVVKILNNLCIGQYCYVKKETNKYDLPKYLAKEFLYMGSDIYMKFIPKKNGEDYFVQIANTWSLTGDGERYTHSHSKNYHRKSPTWEKYGHMVVEIQPKSKDKKADKLFRHLDRFYTKLSKYMRKLNAYIKIPVDVLRKNEDITSTNSFGVKYYKEGILAENETEHLLDDWKDVSDEQKILFKSKVEQIKTSVSDKVYRIKDVLKELNIDLEKAKESFITKRLELIERRIWRDYKDAVNMPDSD